jgi:hypothetical protein
MGIHEHIHARACNNGSSVGSFVFYVVRSTTSYGLDDRGVGVRVPVGSRMFSSPDRPDRL